MVSEYINQLKEDSEIIAASDIEWAKLDKKTVLISGATGYVPQYIVHGIMAHNSIYGSDIRVIALCRSREKAELRFGQYLDRNDFTLIIQDIFLPVRYTEGIDYIIHAASPAGVIKSNKDPLMTFRVNVIGAELLLELAKRKNAKFILFSSVDVYGKNEDGDRFTEDYSGPLDSLDIRNVYACAKRASETLCRCFSASGIETVAVRPTQIMAGGVDLDDGRLHIDFISQIKKNKKIVLKGDGTPLRSFIYVTDAVSAVLTAMILGENGAAYNIANEENEVTVLELAKAMASCADGDIDIVFDMELRKNDPAVKHAVSIVTASSDKIRKLGWYPKINLLDSCKRMMRYYGIRTV